jgi:heme iron utilization protein
MEENTKNALQLLNKENTGVLSTHSLDVEGYPFGSVTPYCLDRGFNPIILVSDLAQHTKNINANAKVSLTIAEASLESEKQALGRYTFLGDAARIDTDTEDYKAVSKVYLDYFPAAKHYFEAHNFYFYRLNFIRGRYIEGFGKIFWIEKDQWGTENVFKVNESEKIIEHMNKDHKQSLAKYCLNEKNRIIDEADQDKLSMVGLYQYGFDLLFKKEKLHFQFSEPVNNTQEARERLVALAKR